MDRRDFLKQTAAGVTVAAGSLALERVAKAAASERLRVGCIGAGGRAFSLVNTFARNAEADVVALADLDPGRLPRAVEAVEQIQGQKPRTTGDFRELIDDPQIDVLCVGTPDHWHAIPTILGCLAGKDVYVEKPDGHNIVEGQRMVAAMRKHKRIVQLGTQSRTSPHFQEAIDYIRTGRLGRCLVAKAWESAKQGSIGHPPDSDPPAGVDYDMWLGSAPKRPFNVRRFHGNWRWFFDYGTGDLGNDGVHRLDVAVRALNAACEAAGEPSLPALPTAICASGGKWYFDDMQEFADTLQVNYEYGDSRTEPSSRLNADSRPGKILTYEMRIWAPYTFHSEAEGAAVYGDQGYIIIGNSRWRAYGPKNELVAEGSGPNHEGPHVQNFIDCVKSRQRPNADLETVGHPSSVLCHAGNISSRVGRKLFLDPETETFLDDPEANALRTRPEYRQPWVLPEV